MPRSSSPTPRPIADPGHHRRRLLVIGPVAALPDVLGEVPGTSAVLAPYEALDEGLLARTRPDEILAALIGTDHDVADVAQRLAEIGYCGLLRCYCRPLPAGHDIAAALAEAFPGLVIELVELRR